MRVEGVAVSAGMSFNGIAALRETVQLMHDREGGGPIPPSGRRFFLAGQGDCVTRQPLAGGCPPTDLNASSQ